MAFFHSVKRHAVTIGLSPSTDSNDTDKISGGLKSSCQKAIIIF